MDSYPSLFEQHCSNAVPHARSSGCHTPSARLKYNTLGNSFSAPACVMCSFAQCWAAALKQPVKWLGFSCCAFQKQPQPSVPEEGWGLGLEQLIPQHTGWRCPVCSRWETPAELGRPVPCASYCCWSFNFISTKFTFTKIKFLKTAWLGKGTSWKIKLLFVNARHELI